MKRIVAAIVMFPVLAFSDGQSPVDLLRDTLVREKVYGEASIVDKCLSFVNEGTDSSVGNEFIVIAVRSECDRKSAWAPLLDRFAVEPATSAVYWVEPTELAKIPFKDWISSRKK